MEVILEGNNIKSITDFHQQIKNAFEFPEYYGENLDALWDCLRYIELPVQLVWTNHAISKAHLNECWTIITELFANAEKELDGFTVKYL